MYSNWTHFRGQSAWNSSRVIRAALSLRVNKDGLRREGVSSTSVSPFRLAVGVRMTLLGLLGVLFLFICCGLPSPAIRGSCFWLGRVVALSLFWLLML